MEINGFTISFEKKKDSDSFWFEARPNDKLNETVKMFYDALVYCIDRECIDIVLKKLDTTGLDLLNKMIEKEIQKRKFKVVE